MTERARTDTKESARSGILERARKNIQTYRMQDIQMIGLEPNRSYTVSLQRHAFPFGTSFRGEGLGALAHGAVAASVTDAFTNRYDVSQTYLQQYYGTIQDDFTGLVEQTWFKWNYMADNTEAAGDINGRIWDFLSQNPDTLQNARGHCVFWNRNVHLPQELKGKPKSDVKEALLKRLDVLNQYPFSEWDLINEPLPHRSSITPTQDVGEVVFDPFEEVDFFADLFKRAKEISPTTRLYINEAGLLNGVRTDEFIALIKALQERGAPIDGIGLQMHIYKGKAIPLEDLDRNLLKLSELGIPLKITEISTSDEVFGSEEDRAKYLRDALTLFFGTPAVEGIYFWGVDKKLNFRNARGEHGEMFTDSFQPNEVGRAFLDLINNEWTTRVPVTADSDGTISFKGFPGVYEVKDEQEDVANAAIATRRTPPQA